MQNIEYIKEKLNTLRVEFMAHILVIIALGSGLSKMYLGGGVFTILNLYSFGVIIFTIITINLIITYIKIDKETKKLKDI
jgi:TM2 domain-containing membrane protein YozV